MAARARDAEAPAQLRRVLHTFKGSARMAGAMRLGELAHRMESRLMVGEEPAAATPALFEALDADLDDIAFLLEGLRAGKSNLELPWVAQAKAAAAPQEPAAVESAPPEIAPAAPARSTCRPSCRSLRRRRPPCRRRRPSRSPRRARCCACAPT